MKFSTKMQDMLIASISENKRINIENMKMRDYIKSLEEVVGFQKRVITKTEDKLSTAISTLKQIQDKNINQYRQGKM